MRHVITQQGSKAIQRILVSDEEEAAVRMLICELNASPKQLISLMCDRYANYACSIAFSALPVETRTS